MNKGLIEAAQVEIKSNAGNIYSLAINQEGIIKTKGIENKNGRIILSAEGKTQNSGEMISKDIDEKGGTIHILSDCIEIKNGSYIDASGNKDGGEILIGGDYQGKNLEIKNAKSLFTDTDAYITASSIEEGNGGKIILWADDTNIYRGNIEAKGGKNSGNGSNRPTTWG